MASRKPTAEQILDQALELAESDSWEAMRLHRLAMALGVGLADIHRHYAQKDDLVEAWFDRADRAMLAASPAAGRLRERLQALIMAWLRSLAPHRRLTGQMLRYKLEPGHLHLQALGVMRISRTVQWFLEAAGVRSTGLRRIAEESLLTAIYLTVFAYWLGDQSHQSERSAALLDRLLARAERGGKTLDRWFPNSRRDSDEPAGTAPPREGADPQGPRPPVH